LAGALDLTQRDTRRYAKRQLTWFRKENEVLWFDGFGRDPSVQTSAQSEVRAFLDCFQLAIQMPKNGGVAGVKCHDDSTDGRI
jgi:hypothetical protein